MITVTPDGNRLEALTLGPIPGVYVPRWHVFFKVKVPLLIQARNLLGISAVFFNAVFKF